jgi:hypothetical protein
LRRSPLESCFAMFRTLFGDAYPFSYALDDLARYYAAWDRLMGHWRALLGPALLEIRYDELVTDPQGQGALRSIAACHGRRATAIEANRAASLTASAAQVRRPIYRTSSTKRRAMAPCSTRCGRRWCATALPIPTESDGAMMKAR